MYVKVRGSCICQLWQTRSILKKVTSKISIPIIASPKCSIVIYKVDALCTLNTHRLTGFWHLLLLLDIRTRNAEYESLNNCTGLKMRSIKLTQFRFTKMHLIIFPIEQAFHRKFPILPDRRFQCIVVSKHWSSSPHRLDRGCPSKNQSQLNYF